MLIVHGALGPSFGEAAETISGWPPRRETLRGWGWGGGGGAGLHSILAQVGWRWLRSALPFKEGKLMFFFPKHNIVREVHNRSLSPVFPCFCVHLQYVCVGVYVFVNVWPWWPQLAHHPRVHKRGGTSFWLSFKVRLAFLKDTPPVNFTSLFRQRISLLTFPPAPPSSRQLHKPSASSFDNDGFLEREKRGAAHFWMNEWREKSCLTALVLYRSSPQNATYFLLCFVFSHCEMFKFKVQTHKVQQLRGLFFIWFTFVPDHSSYTSLQKLYICRGKNYAKGLYLETTRPIKWIDKCQTQTRQRYL